MRTRIRPEIDLSKSEVVALAEFIKFYADMSNDVYALPRAYNYVVALPSSTKTIEGLLRRKLVRAVRSCPISGLVLLEATDRDLVIGCSEIRHLGVKPLSPEQIRAMRQAKKEPICFEGARIVHHGAA